MATPLTVNATGPRSGAETGASSESSGSSGIVHTLFCSLAQQPSVDSKSWFGMPVEVITKLSPITSVVTEHVWVPPAVRSADSIVESLQSQTSAHSSDR